MLDPVPNSKFEDNNRTGTLLLRAETSMIPLANIEKSKRALNQFSDMNDQEFDRMIKMEVRKERITDQIKRQTPEERLEDLKRRNLDFDTLLNEMSKECRNIYEEDIGVHPTKKGRGVDYLDTIIDNLYNDNFRVKNLPPKSVATGSEDLLPQSNRPIFHDIRGSQGFEYDSMLSSPERQSASFGQQNDSGVWQTEKFKINIPMNQGGDLSFNQIDAGHGVDHGQPVLGGLNSTSPNKKDGKSHTEASSNKQTTPGQPLLRSGSFSAALAEAEESQKRKEKSKGSKSKDRKSKADTSNHSSDEAGDEDSDKEAEEEGNEDGDEENNEENNEGGDEEVGEEADNDEEEDKGEEEEGEESPEGEEEAVGDEENDSNDGSDQARNDQNNTNGLMLPTPPSPNNSQSNKGLKGVLASKTPEDLKRSDSKKKVTFSQLPTPKAAD